MPDGTYIAAAVGLSALITFGLRAIPFAIVAPLRESRVVQMLGAQMPAGVMLILVVYLLRDAPHAGAKHATATLVSLAVVVGLHLWRRNPLLSMLAGTAVNVVLLALL